MSTLSTLERGESRLSGDTAEAIAELLGLHAEVVVVACERTKDRPAGVKS
ncbi:MAG: XRE family transcriptional regulator [Hyphomicrobiales bacterium]|nr:MAG: XRE family transcriptional regulator [Hyphomicrobiales bacterium]